ncbi:MAG: hypothetical protein DMD50_09195 [Gemmatimonadetes bacterium]|nr:MAG: hypothetical protein DMD50_09195 [Gemmatimonadota bacterium]
MPPTSVIATPLARSVCSFATVPKWRRGITALYSNQKSNRSPLMRRASPRSGTASRKRWNADSIAGGTCPRWASATTSTREGTAPKLGAAPERRKRRCGILRDVISTITLRVNYSETDQMGVVYHANYLIWFDRARTELMRETGVTYRELEQQGVYLAVSEVKVRYRAAARYDDLVRVRCWVRDLASRRVIFGYAVERAATAELLATGETALVSLTHQHTLTRIPDYVVELLKPVPDPVRV